MDSSSKTGPPAEVKIEETHYIIGAAPPGQRRRAEAIPFKREVAPVPIEDFSSQPEEPQPSTSAQVAEVRYMSNVAVKEEEPEDPYDLSPAAQVKWDPPADAAKRRSVPGGWNPASRDVLTSS